MGFTGERGVIFTWGTFTILSFVRGKCRQDILHAKLKNIKEKKVIQIERRKIYLCGLGTSLHVLLTVPILYNLVCTN
jgi:hypothetical protein